MYFVFGAKNVFGHSPTKDKGEIARWTQLFTHLKDNKNHIIIASNGAIALEDINRFPENTFDIILPDTERTDPKFYKNIAVKLDCPQSDIALIDVSEANRQAALVAGCSAYRAGTANETRSELQKKGLIPGQ